MLPALGLFCFLFYKIVRHVIKLCKKQKAPAVPISDDNENEGEQLALHQVDDNDENLFAYRLVNPDYDKED